MSDNVTLPGTGSAVRSIEKSSKQTQVVTLDVGGSGAETLVAGTVPVSGTVAVTGALTDTQLRASPVPVSGTFYQATQPVSAASLPLPTGAATETTLGTIYTRLGDGSQRLEAGGATGAAVPTRALQIGGSDGTLLRALSVDTSGRPNVNVNGTVPVSGTFWQATQPVSLATNTPDVTDRAGRLLGVATLGAGSAAIGSVVAAGDVASGTADAGNPVKIGGKANSSAPTPVSAGQRVDAWRDLFGRAVVSDLDPELNLAGGMTSLRDRLSAQRYTVLADSIADGLATFWTQTNASGGTTTVTGGEGIIQTSASATGSAQLVSTTPAYLPGQVAWLNSAMRLGDTGSVGNTRRWGAFTVSGTTPQDGFYYELSGTTLNAVVVNAGVVSATASASWSRVAAAPFTLDTSYHSFELRWTANSVYFLIDNVVRHVVSGTTAPITSTLNFPMAIQSINTSGATNRLIAVRNIGIGRFGTPETFSSAGALSVAKAEDAASADADVGIPAMAVRKATPANTSGTDGDYEMLQMSAGRLWTSTAVDTALPAGTAIIGKVGIDQSTPGTTNLVQLGGSLPAGTNTIGAVTGPAAAPLALDASLTGHLQTFKPLTVATTLSAANTTVTLTIAAAGASLFHYITRIRITNINPTAAAIAGSAVTLAYTSTNIPGSLAWTAGNALAAGAEKVVVDEVLSQPIKTSVANTATTIVAPAIGAGGLCRITVYYYTAA